MSNLFTKSLSQSYFTAPASSDDLWQLEGAELGNRAEISNMRAGNIQLQHLLPFDHCGKITVTTPLPMLVS